MTQFHESRSRCWTIWDSIFYQFFHGQNRIGCITTWCRQRSRCWSLIDWWIWLDVTFWNFSNIDCQSSDTLKMVCIGWRWSMTRTLNLMTFHDLRWCFSRSMWIIAIWIQWNRLKSTSYYWIEFNEFSKESRTLSRWSGMPGPGMTWPITDRWSGQPCRLSYLNFLDLVHIDINNRRFAFDNFWWAWRTA